MSQHPVIETEAVKVEINAEKTTNGKIIEQVEAKEEPSEFVDEVKIGGETIFTIPLNMKFEEADYLPKERKTRWGQLIIRKQKVQEDVVFNPLEALISGNSLLPITQYGQSELELKMSIYSDATSRRKSKYAPL